MLALAPANLWSPTLIEKANLLNFKRVQDETQEKESEDKDESENKRELKQKRRKCVKENLLIYCCFPPCSPLS